MPRPAWGAHGGRAAVTRGDTHGGRVAIHVAVTRGDTHGGRVAIHAAAPRRPSPGEGLVSRALCLLDRRWLPAQLGSPPGLCRPRGAPIEDSEHRAVACGHVAAAWRSRGGRAPVTWRPCGGRTAAGETHARGYPRNRRVATACGRRASRGWHPPRLAACCLAVSLPSSVAAASAPASSSRDTTSTRACAAAEWRGVEPPRLRQSTSIPSCCSSHATASARPLAAAQCSAVLPRSDSAVSSDLRQQGGGGAGQQRLSSLLGPGAVARRSRGGRAAVTDTGW